MKRIISIILVFALGLSILCACGEKAEPQPAEPKNEAKTEETKTEEKKEEKKAEPKKLDLMVAAHHEPTTMNPHNANDANTSFYCSQIYNGLVTFNENNELVCDLAESYEWLDDTHIRFHLRKGVKFHNGEEMKADDVLFSYQAMCASSFISTLGAVNPDELKVVDDYTFDMGLFNYDASILYNLTGYILNRKATENVAAEAYDENPVGTGYMKFVEWVPGDHIKLEVNPDYFDTPVTEFRTVTYRRIDEASTRALEVETGSCDWSTNISVNDAKRLAENKDVYVHVANLSCHYFVSFNVQKEPFNNPKVREAIAHAINAAEIRASAQQGFADECGSPCMAPDVFGYYDCGGDYEYNVEYAKQCLTEAGYPNGFSTTIIANNQPVVTEMVQFELAQIGITVEINNADRATWISALVDGNQDMYVGGWTNGTGDANYSMQAFHSANFGGGGNRTRYSNPEVDALIDKAAASHDQNERAELYKQAQQIVYDDFVYIPIWVNPQLHLVRKDISDYVIRSSQKPMYNLLKIDRK